MLLNLRGISKSYKAGDRTIPVLSHINFGVHKGEFLALMGPSGCGKSTLLNILGCLDRPTEGIYELNGKDVFDLNDQQLALLRAESIGFVFQSFNLIPQLNVYENVEVPLLYSVKKKIDHSEKIKRAVDLVGLSHRITHFPSQLSGGECQRVAIARALVIEPSLILADEPTGNLDTVNSRLIMELFQKLHIDGTTILVVTHDPEISKQCQRTLRILDGALCLDS